MRSKRFRGVLCDFSTFERVETGTRAKRKKMERVGWGGGGGGGGGGRRRSFRFFHYHRNYRAVKREKRRIA